LFGLVHPVEHGVPGVQLDGGEDSITSRGGGCGSDSGGSNVGIGGRSDGKVMWKSSVGNGSDLGRPPGAADHAVPEVIGNIGDAVVASLVDVGVAAGDAVAVGSSALLGGVVDVLVTVGSVASLVLGSVLAAGHLGSNGSNSCNGSNGSNSRSGSSKGSSSMVSGSNTVISSGSNTIGAVGCVGSVAKASSVGNWVLGCGSGHGGGEQNLWFVNV